MSKVEFLNRVFVLSKNGVYRWSHHLRQSYVIFFIGYDTLALDPIIIKYIHLAVIKITVNHIFLLIC